MRKLEGWFFSNVKMSLLLVLPLLFAISGLLLKCYVAAQTEKGALRMMVVLHLLGFGVISDLLGEAVVYARSANRNTARLILHMRRMAALRGKHPDIRLALAVKPSMIGLKINKPLARRNLQRIHRASQKYGLRLEIDMEGPEMMDATVEIVRSLLRQGYNFRQVIQANQKKSGRLMTICGMLHISVRLVKGAYRGDIKDRGEIDANYLELARLAEHYSLDTAYGTHDKKLLNRAQTAHKGTVQKLFGVRMFDLPADEIYMAWGPPKRAWRFLFRRIKEGVRPAVLIMFLRNIPESLFWRIRHAPLSFLY